MYISVASKTLFRHILLIISNYFRHCDPSLYPRGMTPDVKSSQQSTPSWTLDFHSIRSICP